MKEDEVPNHIRESVYEYVRSDLQPTRAVVHAKIGFSVMLGGLVSLFLCGQLGLGFSPLAMAVHHFMMDWGGFLGCTALCGVLFAVIPVLTLRLLSTGIQFLVLVRKEWGAITGWTVAFGIILVFQNDRSDSLPVLVLWGLAAVCSFELLARLVARLRLPVFAYASR